MVPRLQQQNNKARKNIVAQQHKQERRLRGIVGESENAAGGEHTTLLRLIHVTSSTGGTCPFLSESPGDHTSTHLSTEILAHRLPGYCARVSVRYTCFSLKHLHVLTSPRENVNANYYRMSAIVLS